MIVPSSITLEGATVRLEPLRLDHIDALMPVALDPDLWQWTTVQVASREDLRRYIDVALRDRDAGHALPFAIVLKATGEVVGCTRYGNIAPVHRRVEIGWTWVARTWQRTAVNPEAKRLLLGYAFETLGCIRVELKTDARNLRSRRAIEKLGAVQEGLLRQHIVTETGRVRDTVYYSILADEWPAVRDTLDARLRCE